MADETATPNGKHGDVLFIHALTGLHPGSGTALGVVDLPVQRERHTQWPLVPGSTVKGVLRDCCRGKGVNTGTLEAMFGPDTGNASEHAGAVSFTDARILAFPVRSLKGVFAWVTCPGVLDRLNRDLGLVGAGGLPDIPRPAKNQAACSSSLVVDNVLVLEEFDFQRDEDAGSLREELARWLSRKTVNDEATGARLLSNLVVLHDDDFTYFVRHATEVMARIGLDYEKKTVKTGALFYQEFLPPETIFYSLVLASASRKRDTALSAGEIISALGDSLTEVIQIGADETIGKGLCALRLLKGRK